MTRKVASRTARAPAADDAPARTGRVIGYARTSTTDQKLDLQLDALKAAGADPVFTDQLSGAKQKRPGLDKALGTLAEGDTLAVWKLDRLGRSLSHLVTVIAGLHEQGVAFRSLTEGIDSNTAHGRLLLGLFGSLAEYERELTKERITAGREAAKRRGQRFGPIPKMTMEKVDIARREIAAGSKPASVARALGVSRATMYAAFIKADEAAAIKAKTDYEKRGRGRPRKKIVTSPIYNPQYESDVP